MSPVRAASARAMLLGLLACGYGTATADDSVYNHEIAPGYRRPPAPIARMLDAAPAPTALVSPGAKTVALLGRRSLPPLAELARPSLGLAGYRIDPATNGPASGRVHGLTSLVFIDVSTGARRDVVLPDDARFIGPEWSPDGANLAFLMVRQDGIELWTAEAATGKARALTEPVINSAFRSGYEWLPDGSGLMASLVLADRGAPPRSPRAPSSPVVQENAGRAAPAPTYQDLLRNPTDKALFEYYFTSRLALVPVEGGRPRSIGKPGLISEFSIAPGGGYILQTRLYPPFSYSVPATRFPAEVSVTDLSGDTVSIVATLPLRDSVSGDGRVTMMAPRTVQWRADAAATLVWAQAQEPDRSSEQTHDRVYVQDAPFDDDPIELIELDGRFGGVWWGGKGFAIVVSHRPEKSLETRIVVDPSTPGGGRVLQQRRYRDTTTGRPMLIANDRGKPVLNLTADGQGVFLRGTDASPAGLHPFLARMNLATGETRRLWQSAPPFHETPVAIVGGGDSLIVWRESKDTPPNLYVVDPTGDDLPRPLTGFEDPAPELAGIRRRLLTYQRADGVTLSGTLYLPAGYDRSHDGRLPLLVWAYPAEYSSVEAAEQVVGSGSRFVRPHGVSPLFMLTQGYAVLNGPTMPIIGQHGAAPNDAYIDQLVMDAEAAVHAVVDLGIADPDAIAIGGHSYGASMAANLLAHTDLFRAGIALSGAYNRTLTPFGFQTEERSYWDAVDTYTEMSPFTHVEKINEPILLVHGGADPNTGTFPLQSERFYAALKGTGATARYVMLPLEGHGYYARDSVMHVLWEMARWLDLHVKPASAH